MEFNIGDFTIITRKKTEQLEDKQREFTIFHKLGFKDTLVADNIFHFIALIEAIKGFAGNRFTDEKIYKINDNISARMAQKDKLKYLKLELSKHTLFLDKLECSILSAQLSKIVQRCEAWQKQESEA